MIENIKDRIELEHLRGVSKGWAKGMRNYTELDEALKEFIEKGGIARIADAFEEIEQKLEKLLEIS